MAHSTTRATPRKPSKLDPIWRIQWGLHPQFPLFPHPSGRWAKRVRGLLYYFGKVGDDPKGKAALQRWNEHKDDLIAEREPRAKHEGTTVSDLCNAFLAAKRAKVSLGTMTGRSFVEYTKTTDMLVSTFGRNRLAEDLGPADFERLYLTLSKAHGIRTIGREVTHVKSVFRYGYDSDLLTKVVKFGQLFRRRRRPLARSHVRLEMLAKSFRPTAGLLRLGQPRFASL